MQPTLDVRRHHDGSVDFGFYHRRAARRRRLLRRMAIRRFGMLLASAMQSALAAIKKPSQGMELAHAR